MPMGAARPCGSFALVWETWLAVAIGLLVVGVVAAVYIDRRRSTGSGFVGPRRPSRDQFRRGEEPPPRRVTIIVNPTKVEDMAVLRAGLSGLVTGLGWAEPTVVETTVEDPGFGQARAAVADGVDLVCALGGDGTVRTVAQVLAGTNTPMGLLPTGTGNLLARNLQLPLERLDHAVEVALTGFNRHIDIGWATVDPAPDQLERHPGGTDDTSGVPADNVRAFLVMAGLGFDAAIMEGTSEELKARVGWPAYVAGGAKSLLRARFKTGLVIDDGEESTHRARTVVVGNCGVLTGGITLMPDAEVDDGILDVVALTPRGIGGWAGVAAHVLTQRRKDHSRLERYRCRRALVTVEEPQRVQMDGDVMGEARQVLFTIQPRGLIVRVATIPPRGPAV
jgi:diacylglycerol kinase family enzyme